MHEGDGQRFDLFFFHQTPHRVSNRDFRQRQHHVTIDADPLGYFQPSAARHQRRAGFQEQVVQVVARLAADLDAVAESFCRQQPNRRALAFDDGVGHQRRAMHHAVHVAGTDLRLPQQPGKTFDDGDARVLGRGEELARVNKVACRVVQHEIGECAADIDPDAHVRCWFIHRVHSKP